MSEHPAADVMVTFRRLIPTDEVVYYARKCAAGVRMPISGVDIEAYRKLGLQAFRVIVRVATEVGEIEVQHADPDVYLAVRDAFEMVSRRAGVSFSELTLNQGLAHAATSHERLRSGGTVR